MKKIFLTSVLAIAMSVPAIADPVTPNIAVGTNPADCTEPVLGTTSGTSNLEANWNPNTLYLEWISDADPNYSPNNKSSETCTYDSGITIPTNNPSKTGYTFAGWHVKSVTQSCGLSKWTSGTVQNYGYKSVNGQGANMNDTGLSNGEWFVETSTGTLKGLARCSNKAGNHNDFAFDNDSSNWLASEDQLTQAGHGLYCWCAVDTLNNVSCPKTSTSSWVFSLEADHMEHDDCLHSCSLYCLVPLASHPSYLSALLSTAE